MTTIEQASSAITENLHQVFGEADAGRRKEAIARIWTSSDQSVFVDPEKTYHGHGEVDECVADLQKKFAGWVFTETSKPKTHLWQGFKLEGSQTSAAPVTILPTSVEAKVRFAKVRWGYGPPGEMPKVYGEDVAVVVDGRLQSLCAFIDGGPDLSTHAR